MADPYKKLFIKYKNSHNTFIDMDVHKGEHVESSLGAGFNEIHAFKVSDSNEKNLKNRFSRSNEVNLYKGTITSDSFQSVLGNLSEPAMFYIDLFKRHALDPDKPTWSVCSLLDCIKRRTKLPHTILIKNSDRLSDSDKLEFHLNRIHESYCIEYEDINKSDNVLCAFSD